MSSDEEVEQCLCTIRRCFIYKIPPRTSGMGYRAAGWNNQVWYGKLQVMLRGERCVVEFIDDDDNLFAKAPIRDDGPSVCPASGRSSPRLSSPSLIVPDTSSSESRRTRRRPTSVSVSRRDLRLSISRSPFRSTRSMSFPALSSVGISRSPRKRTRTKRRTTTASLRVRLSTSISTSSPRREETTERLLPATSMLIPTVSLLLPQLRAAVSFLPPLLCLARRTRRAAAPKKARAAAPAAPAETEDLADFGSAPAAAPAAETSVYVSSVPVYRSSDDIFNMF